MTVLSYSSANLQKKFENFPKMARFGPKLQQKLGKTRKNSETPFFLLYLCSAFEKQRQCAGWSRSMQLTTIY